MDLNSQRSWRVLGGGGGATEMNNLEILKLLKWVLKC